MKTYILFFFCIFNLLANANSPFENSSDQNNSEEKYEFFSSTDEILFPKYKKLDPELRNIILDIAPKAVKVLVLQMQECTKNPKKKCPSHLLFTGGNEISRKKLAQAIAENADIPYVQINTPFLLNSDKTLNAETVKFIDNIIKTTNKVIITFAGLDCVSDGNYAAAVSLLINRFENNANISVIGIMNTPHKMPPFLKEKFLVDTYLIEDTSTVKQKKELLHHHLKKFNNECNEKCEDHISKLLKIAESEDIEDIVEHANYMSFLGQGKQAITQRNLEDAINQYKDNLKFFEKRK